MAEQTDAFNWILAAKTLKELNEVADKIEKTFIDVSFAKYAFIIRRYELLEEAGLISLGKGIGKNKRLH